jgi:hypothetical protein
MTIQPKESVWTDLEIDILLQCGKAWKKDSRINWKNYEQILSGLLPQKSVNDCKKQYKLITHQYDKSTKYAAAKGGVEKSLLLSKRCVTLSSLQKDEAFTYSQPIDDDDFCRQLGFKKSPIHLFKTPIGAQARVYVNSPFAFPPLFEIPLQPQVFQLYPNSDQPLSSLLPTHEYSQANITTNSPSEHSMRSTPILETSAVENCEEDCDMVMDLQAFDQPFNYKPELDEFGEFSKFFDR